MKFITKAAGIVAVAVLAAGGVLAIGGHASAQEATPTANAAQTKRQEVRADFFAKLATNLNVSVDQLKSAIKNAELGVVDDLVADGTITADQAAKAREKINNSEGFALARLFGQRREEVRERVRKEIIVSSATAIGVKPKELVAELKDGKSIADVAGEHNVSLDTVKAQVTSAAKTKLDKAVVNGKLTQPQADAALERLTSRLDDLLNKHKAQ